MLHDYTQTVRSFYNSFARRDAQLFIALLDPQIEWTAAENFLYADQSHPGLSRFSIELNLSGFVSDGHVCSTISSDAESYVH